MFGFGKKHSDLDKKLADGDKLTVHVTNHGAPLDTVGATGKLTVLSGTNKQDIQLKPAGGNRLEGAGSYAAGAKLLLQVQLLGKKPLQARAVAQ